MAWHLAFRCFPYPFPGIPGFHRWAVKDWAFAGSHLMDVVFGSGHTRWKIADAAAPDGQGWKAVAVDPDIVAARAAGLSFGFCLWDEVGTTWSCDEQGFHPAG